MEGELRICKGGVVFQMEAAATAKLREPKHVRTRGTDSKLESDECKLRDGTYCFIRKCKYIVGNTYAKI